MRESDAYAVLHVQPGADPDVVSAAYRTLARRYHPDGPTPDPGRMAELNRAYNEVKTPVLRHRYDTARGLVGVGPGRPAEAAASDPSRRPVMTAPPPARTGSEPQRPAAGGPTSQASASTLSADPPSLRARSTGGLVLDFGRYAGWSIPELARHDPDYLRWLSRHSAGIRFRQDIARCLPGDREVGRRVAALA